MDFQKAFDSVDHGILLNKLSAFGFTTELRNLFASYLTERKAYVYYKGMRSPIFVPTSGVPQGANLGTLLFSIFIDDLAHELGQDALLFADDLKLLRTISNQDDIDILQLQINRVSRWCAMNRLSLNINKCAVLSFTRSLTPVIQQYKIGEMLLNRVDTFRDLGVTFDSRLTFRTHANSVVGSAFRAAGFIMRNCMNFRSIVTLRVLHYALVRSKLEYASVVWSPNERCRVLDLDAV